MLKEITLAAILAVQPQTAEPEPGLEALLKNKTFAEILNVVPMPENRRTSFFLIPPEKTAPNISIEPSFPQTDQQLYLNDFELDKFTISTDNAPSSIPIFLKGNEEEGLKYLYSQLGSFQYSEQGFLYIPSLYVWIDVGGESILKPNNTYQLNLRTDLIERIAQKENRLVIYHSHPFNKNMANHIRESLKEIKMENKFEEVYYLHVLPSLDDDIEQAVGQVRKLKQINSKLLMQHKVISVYGVVDYSVSQRTQEIISYPTRTSLSYDFRNLTNAFKVIHDVRKARRRFQSNYESVVLDAVMETEFSEAYLANICEKASDGFIQLQYFPRETGLQSLGYP